MHLLFAYGILKNDGKLIIQDHGIDATMYNLGSFPGITALDTGFTAVGNVIEVTDKDMEKYDVIEGVPHFYDRHTINTPAGKAFIYILQSVPVELEQISIWEPYR